MCFDHRARYFNRFKTKCDFKLPLSCCARQTPAQTQFTTTPVRSSTPCRLSLCDWTKHAIWSGKLDRASFRTTPTTGQPGQTMSLTHDPGLGKTTVATKLTKQTSTDEGTTSKSHQSHNSRSFSRHQWAHFNGHPNPAGGLRPWSASCRQKLQAKCSCTRPDEKSSC